MNGVSYMTGKGKVGVTKAAEGVPTPDAEGGAQALREASDALVREVAAWVGALPAPQ